MRRSFCSKFALSNQLIVAIVVSNDQIIVRQFRLYRIHVDNIRHSSEHLLRKYFYWKSLIQTPLVLCLCEMRLLSLSFLSFITTPDAAIPRSINFKNAFVRMTSPETAKRKTMKTLINAKTPSTIIHIL